jgi:CDP-6-deoxy-D-xylo-4-hexulose-3-dehydrase
MSWPTPRACGKNCGGSESSSPAAIRVIGDLAGADRIMNEAVFAGVYSGLARAMMDYRVERIHEFVRSR